MLERGATDEEVAGAVRDGERFPARFGRTGFRRNFPFDNTWQGVRCSMKQIEAFAVRKTDCWLVITVIVRYY